MPFHLLIIKETPLSLLLSILGAICAGMAFMLGGTAFHFMFEKMDAEGSVGWWLACLGFGAAAFVFYFIAFKSSKKARERRLETEREYANKKFMLSSENPEQK